MTPEEFRDRLGAVLETVDVRDESWSAVASRRGARRTRNGRRATATAVTALATVAVAVAVALVGVNANSGHTRPVAQPSSKSPSGAGTPRVTLGAASKPGFFVYVGGQNLEGPDLSSTMIEGGNSSSPPSQNGDVVLGSSAGQAFWSPSLNPAKTEVVFVSGSASSVGANSGEGDIVRTGITGASPKTLTTTGTDGDPQWSPNGKQIAFLRGGKLWIMNADGSDQRSLGILLSAHSLAWSPNGKQLAVGSGDSPERIAIVTLSSQTFRWFTPRGVEQYQPAWSPDGKQLVYGQTGPNTLFVSDLNGKDAKQVTTCKLPKCTQDVQPAWSPDGSQIAFVVNDYGVQQIAVVSASGGQIKMLTTGSQQHNLPSW